MQQPVSPLVSLPVSQPVSPVVRTAPIAPAISKVTAPLVVPSDELSPPKSQNSGGISAPPLAQSSPIEQELGDEADAADATVEELPEISALPTAIAVPTASVVAEPNLEQIWFSILGLIHPPGTRELFKQQGRLLALEPEIARVGITSQPLFKMAQMRVANLEAAFAQLQERPVKVSLEVVAALATSPAVSSPMERSSSPPAGKAQAFSNGSNGTVSEASIAYKPEPPTPKPSPVSQPQASSPPQDSPADAPAQWQSEDAVSRAAKSFAQMFNGQIVSGTDPEPSPSDVVILDLEPEVGDPDDDVPF
jgi:DNA polymerase-3 subunit gamma/tau